MCTTSTGLLTRQSLGRTHEPAPPTPAVGIAHGTATVPAPTDGPGFVPRPLGPSQPWPSPAVRPVLLVPNQQPERGLSLPNVLIVLSDGQLEAVYASEPNVAAFVLNYDAQGRNLDTRESQCLMVGFPHDADVRAWDLDPRSDPPVDD
jgi:hypothetical protein